MSRSPDEIDDERRLIISFPHLPPSENRIRVHRWQGGMVYSNEAKGYRQQFTDYVRENYVVDVAQFVSGHTERSVYALDMVFTFPTVINKGWAKKKAKTLYKRFDVGNRRKLLEDCLVEVLGEIDDSLFFEVRMVKLMGDPGVVLTVTEVSPSEYGIPYVRRNK